MPDAFLVARNRRRQEWTYRFLVAALTEAGSEAIGEIRAWAALNGYEVADRGRISAQIRGAFDRRHE